MHDLHPRKLSPKFLRRKPILVVTLGSLIWALSAATTAQAACDFTFSSKLTVYQQDLVDEFVTPTLVESTFKQIKITTQDVLNLLATHYSTSFPTGSKLCHDRDDAKMKVYDKNGTLLLTIDEAVMKFTYVEPTFQIVEIPDQWVIKCDTLPSPPPECVDIPATKLVLENPNELALSRTRDIGGAFVSGQYWSIAVLNLTSPPAIDVVFGGQMIFKFTWKTPDLFMKTLQTINVLGRGTFAGAEAIFSGTILFNGKPLLLNGVVTPPAP